MKGHIMTKVQFRRWVVKYIECCICMVIFTVGCIAVCYIVSGCLKLLGVA